MQKTILELIDLINPEKIVDLCLRNGKYKLIFDVLKSLKFKQDLDHCPRFQLIIWMFNETLARNQHQFAIQVLSQYEGMILTESD